MTTRRGGAATSGDGQVWAIVLAAGEGTRLSAVTAAVHGRAVPKQFAAIHGDRTFLQRTLDRIAPACPPHRTVVVVAEGQRALAEEQLAEYAGIEIVFQPRNRGTGAGLLLPLAHVLARDPKARVVVLPSDHHIQRESRFLAAVKQALWVARHCPVGVALIGAAAESAATDLGWITGGAPLPMLLDPADFGSGLDGITARTVQQFVEKPDATRALELLQQGALWNTLILAARGEALWALARRHVPQAEALLRGYREQLVSLGPLAARDRLQGLYADLISTDLSRDILEHASGLAVLPMVDAGWSDCGTPERLFRVLDGEDRRTVQAAWRRSGRQPNARGLVLPS
jgi:mannose-1-phosphate guanylyltransferase